MLSGAPPPTLSNSVVAWHPQTWRLREYHLLLPEDLGDEAKMTAAVEHPRYKPLSPGDPLRAYLPQGLTIDHTSNGVNVYEPGRVADTFYHRSPAPEHITAEYAERIREILIAGEVGAHFLYLVFSKDVDEPFFFLLVLSFLVGTMTTLVLFCPPGAFCMGRI
jgi:hypothetical protein